MSSKKISVLTDLPTSADDDELVIVDTSANETKKQTKVNLLKEVYTKTEVDALIAAVSVLTIDLSAQCNSVLTAFDLGRTVKAVICVNLNGTFISSTLNEAKDEITLELSPDSGEELQAITFI